ncbi:spore germination protein [Pseudalkalibacillus caeni]|uniref:Spore germination protein n=1 Tax=Exobacillus caeni TaxID=2574798 RepID=A0A5R9EVT7_9BACL|nr:spore germination protein [Pseudalkalibacillus caeni]TLS35342.1 spore germination protein [Pseudalkalibacillus caeni]
MKIYRNKNKQAKEKSAGKHLDKDAISPEVDENIETIKQRLGDPFDFMARSYSYGKDRFALCYIDGMVSKDDLERTIVYPLMDWLRENDSFDTIGDRDFRQHIQIPTKMKETTSLSSTMDDLLRGNIVLFVQGRRQAFIASDQEWATRAISEPESQTLIRGPREGFVETLSINATLIRRRITNPALRFKSFVIGKVTKTQILVTYIEGYVNENALKEVINRIESVDTLEVYETGMLEELMEEKGYSPFPTIQSTERPDVVCSALTEGKVSILMEGTPFVLIAPTTFMSFFQAAEDYYTRFDLSTFIRMIRFISFWISLALPATYVALTTFHQELIPTNLLVSLAAQREGIPFPALIEALVMEGVFEILREAGIRMPRQIGPAVSIVGAIVIGEAAVAAGLVSPAIVIVVSLTAIASFANPYYSISGSARLLRFILMLFAASAGIFGMIVFTLALFIHLVSLKSLGQPFLSPLAPLSVKKQKDAFFRFPLWWEDRKKKKKVGG